MAKIRHEKAEKEKMDTIEQEKARRRQGREINDIKQKHHENELKRIAEEKRAEKKADAAYKFVFALLLLCFWFKFSFIVNVNV